MIDSDVLFCNYPEHLTDFDGKSQGTDLPTEDSKPSVGYSKAQLRAEYKQLLNELPEKAKYPPDANDLTEPVETAIVAHNAVLDQCRAIILKHIEEME